MLAPRYRERKAAAQWEAVRQWKPEPAYDAPVRLEVSLYPPSRRRYDLLNYTKLICDALTGVCFTDDSLVRSAEWQKMNPDRADPRAEIMVTLI